MGIASNKSLQNKRRYAEYINKTAFPACGEVDNLTLDFMHPDIEINVTAPFDRIDGSTACIDTLMAPMRQAFRHLSRRTDMILGGEYKGEEWVLSHGHYVGEFVNDWIGIPANGEVVWLHAIEYHRMVDNQAVETYLYFDMLDLLRQIGRSPLNTALGFEGFVPGPANGCGISLCDQSPAESAASLDMVDSMLSELWTADEKWRPYWHPDMLWYGPSGYGSQIGIDGFERFQLPYEGMFVPGSFSGEVRQSGDSDLDNRVCGHFTRFGDGQFVASGGWPSHGGRMGMDWLGIKGNDKLFTVRVADVWRREGGLLVENWVFVDLIDMARQLGRDLFAAAGIEIEF